MLSDRLPHRGYTATPTPPPLEWRAERSAASGGMALEKTRALPAALNQDGRRPGQCCARNSPAGDAAAAGVLDRDMQEASDRLIFVATMLEDDARHAQQVADVGGVFAPFRTCRAWIVRA